MNPEPATMFVYALHDPIDDFDALTPLPQWIADDPPRRTRWALQAVLALADTATQVRWDGDMRHQPSVGTALVPPDACPYLVVKQDNNGTTFVITAAPLPGLDGHTRHAGQTRTRDIGAWTHPTLDDIAVAPTITTAAASALPRHTQDPPF